MKRLLLIFILLLTSIISINTSASFISPDPRVEKFDTLVSGYYNSGKFSGGVLIAERGNIIFKKMYGLANREDDISNESVTKFRIGSITKQFTATAIMLLQQQGKLSVHDTIRKYIPDYPAIGDKITIHQLLTHTSGIPEYVSYPDFENIAMRHVSFIELINRFKDKPLDFEPGTQWKYSNSGYVLLGYLIEKASGMSYETFLKRNIFIPAKLNNTVTENPRTVTHQRAKGYDFLPENNIVNAEYIDLSSTQAAGNILSTLDDLYQWDRTLYKLSILTDASKSEMFKDQSGTGYGYGWAIDEAFGHKRVRHGGAINGFLSEFSRYIDADATVIVWNNTISGEPNREMADALAAILFNTPNEDILNCNQFSQKNINKFLYY